MTRPVTGHEDSRGLSDDAPRVPGPIADALRRAGGRVTFADFMELALTHPQAGYYALRESVIGSEGDFTTAPRAARAFNRAMARLVGQLADVAEGRRVMLIEVGAGEGDLMAGILQQWSVERADLRDRVSIRTVDVSPRMRERLGHALAPWAAAGWDVGVVEDMAATRLHEGPEPVAVVVSNELVDALPVHLVDVTADRPREAWVRLSGPDQASLREEWADLSPEAEREMRLLFDSIEAPAVRPFCREGLIELRPAAGRTLRSWASMWPDLCVVTIDYGDRLAGPGAGAAAGARLHGRTLRGYYRHRVTDDPYQAVGRQDLTADVDFRALDRHGAAVGLECVVYTTLATFLKGMGAIDEAERLLETAHESLEVDQEVTALAKLLDEGGLGGEFKVMVQVGEA